MVSSIRKSQEGVVKSKLTILPPGGRAPEFSLNSTPDQKVSLSEFQGAP